MNFMTFHILGTIIPTDEVHHFSEGLKPPTRISYSDVPSCFGVVKWATLNGPKTNLDYESSSFLRLSNGQTSRERFRIRVVARITRVSVFSNVEFVKKYRKKTPKVHGDKPSLSPLKMAIKLVCIAYEHREIHLRSMFQLSSSSFPFGMLIPNKFHRSI